VTWKSSEDLAAFRRRLHRLAEPSGSEERTARAVRDRLAACGPREILEGLGGNGLAAVFGGPAPGPRILVRCELDAVRVREVPGRPHGSETEGISHACGHDGHMALLAGLASLLAEAPPARGEAVLLFQPAEETGNGALAVIEDPSFRRILPDRVFALHNLPGFPLGQVLLRDGTFAYAAGGLTLRWTGASSHASQPEAGRSPLPALVELVGDLRGPGAAGPPYPPGAYGTVTHLRLGEPTFGVSPGTALLMATLRAETTGDLEALLRTVRERIGRLSEEHGLALDVDCREVFPATVNDADAVRRVEEAAAASGMESRRIPGPFRWSEDFGHFTARFPGALFGLGSGPDRAPLHHPEYDFPDALLAEGSRLLFEILRPFLR